MRNRLHWVVALVTAFAALLSGVAHAYSTASALIVGGAWFVYRMRSAHAAAQPLTDWLIALEGKDPFNPDAVPDYQWRGFATSWCIAIAVSNHPTLASNALLLFRDEVSDEDWRALKTRIAHGPHALISAKRAHERF